MKLQVALDTLSLEECIELLNQVRKEIDIAEVGTPMIIEYGMAPVRELHRLFPEMEILADTKIMDAGEYEAEMCFKAGAAIVTVLGVTHDETIRGALKAAKKYGGKILIDMIGVEDLARRTQQIDALGVDYICVHTAFDLQVGGANPLEELRMINSVLRNAQAAVAGGVKLATIESILHENPEIIIVGGGITNQADPAAVTAKMKTIMKAAQ